MESVITGARILIIYNHASIICGCACNLSNKPFTTAWKGNCDYYVRCRVLLKYAAASVLPSG